MLPQGELCGLSGGHSLPKESALLAFQNPIIWVELCWIGKNSPDRQAVESPGAGTRWPHRAMAGMELAGGKAALESISATYLFLPVPPLSPKHVSTSSPAGMLRVKWLWSKVAGRGWDPRPPH